MNSLRRQARLRLEVLESRDNPGNLTVAFADHTLTITGETDNTLTVEGNGSDKTQFFIESSGSDTFNGSPSPYSSPTGVQNITIDLGGGGETINFDDAIIPLDLEGSLTINTGTGSNTVESTNLTVQKNLSITNGANDGGTTTNRLGNLNVGGNVTIHNGNGNDENLIYRLSAGISSIGGSLSITNNAGMHENGVLDTNVGGNVSISNGAADAGDNPGDTQIFNIYNSFRSVIRGNLTVTYANGNGVGNGEYDGVWDAEVDGNVTFNHGTGAFTTYFDGLTTALPDLIGGSLTMTGAGSNLIDVGTQYQHTGLIVDKNLTISSPSDSTGGDDLMINRLQVMGNTTLSFLSSNNKVAIDQSQFEGAFNLTFVNASNYLYMEAGSNDTQPTEFDKAVNWIMAGSYAEIALYSDVVFASTLDFKEPGLFAYTAANVIFLFGGSLP